jgi:hypothetical protein
MFDSYTEGKHNAIMEQTQNRPMTAIFRLVLNHWPILQRTTRFVKPFINELEPNIILKGDSHHVCSEFFLFELNQIENIFFIVFYNFL